MLSYAYSGMIIGWLNHGSHRPCPRNLESRSSTRVVAHIGHDIDQMHACSLSCHSRALNFPRQATFSGQHEPVTVKMLRAQHNFDVSLLVNPSRSSRRRHAGILKTLDYTNRDSAHEDKAPELRNWWQSLPGTGHPGLPEFGHHSPCPHAFPELLEPDGIQDQPLTARQDGARGKKLQKQMPNNRIELLTFALLNVAVKLY